MTARRLDRIAGDSAAEPAPDTRGERADGPARHGILVGVDGSDHSVAAACWGAREALTRSLPLTLARVVQAPAGGAEYERQLRTTEGDLERVRSQPPLSSGIEVRDLATAGTASHELIRLAADAELVVVGARGRGGFAGLMLGSVSDQVSTHAPTSVAVVREYLERPGAPIFLGVDDSPGTVPAVDFAFATAERDDRAIVVLYAYPMPALIPEVGYVPVSQHAHYEDRARAFVRRFLRPWERRYPGVTTTVQVTTQSPGPALVEVSSEAHLVVVGAHARSHATGLLGSVPRRVLHQAQCPSVVAR